MSRIGKRPVILPKGVTARIDGGVVTIKGPKGESHLQAGKERYKFIDLKLEGDKIIVSRTEETKFSRTEQGLIRALVGNMVEGVTKGYSRSLDVVGVGYKAELKGKSLSLSVGLSHPVDYVPPTGVTVTVDKQTRIVVSGVDKKSVGEAAACIRRFRPPEPYKGKGIRYVDEIVRRKVGKAAAGAAGGK